MDINKKKNKERKSVTYNLKNILQTQDKHNLTPYVLQCYCPFSARQKRKREKEKGQ